MLPRTGLAAALITVVTAAALPLDTAHAAGPTCAGLTATIIGTAGPDNLTGTAGPDVVFLGTGSDHFDGRGGDDTICGGPGDDAIEGGDGNDRLYGEDGGDHLAGGAGNDTVVTGTGANSVGEGPGDDTLRGGPGTDELDYLWSSTHGSSDSGVVIDAVAGTASGYGNDTLHGFDYFSLTSNADRFRGRDVNERVYSYGGEDTIWTAGGNDGVVIGRGTKVVNLGPGDDIILDGGNSATRISLGGGDDRAQVGRAKVVSGGDGNDVLSTYTPGSNLVGGAGSDRFLGVGDRDTLTGDYIDLAEKHAYIHDNSTYLWHLDSIENASGTPYDDYIHGTSGANILFGGDGNDFILGRGGNDSISGGPGDDVIVR